LANAFDGGCKVLPYFNALISKKPCDDKLLHILDGKHFIDMRPFIGVEAIDKVTILN
jgi:hypothetical protein